MSTSKPQPTAPVPPVSPASDKEGAPVGTGTPIPHDKPPPSSGQSGSKKG